MTSTRQKTREMLNKAEKCYICLSPTLKSIKIPEIKEEYLKTLALCVPEFVSFFFFLFETFVIVFLCRNCRITVFFVKIVVTS